MVTHESLKKTSKKKRLKMYLLKYSWSSITRNAWRNRQELISAGLTSRRDLMKLGLLTSTGYLLAKHGLSSRVANAKEMVSPATRAFVEPLPIMPVKRPLINGANSLSPYPSVAPNNLQGERAHAAAPGLHQLSGQVCVSTAEGLRDPPARGAGL